MESNIGEHSLDLELHFRNWSWLSVNMYIFLIRMCMTLKFTLFEKIFRLTSSVNAK